MRWSWSMTGLTVPPEPGDCRWHAGPRHCDRHDARRGGLADRAGRHSRAERSHRRPQRLWAAAVGDDHFSVARRSGVADAALIKGDLSAQLLHLGGPQGVKRPGLDRDQQSECRVERAGVARRPGRRQQALGAAARFGRQQRGTSRNAAAAAKPPRACARSAESSSSAATSSSGPARPAPGARRGPNRPADP